MTCSAVHNNLSPLRAARDPREDRPGRCVAAASRAQRSSRESLRPGVSLSVGAFLRKALFRICPTPNRSCAAVASAELSPDRFRDLLGLAREPEPVLREILTRDEFQETLSQSILEQIVDHILDLFQQALLWISEHWPKLDFGSFQGRADLLWQALGLFLFSAIVALLVGVGALLVYRVLLPYARSRGHQAATQRPQPSGESSLGGSLRNQALRLAREGRYDDAIVRLFRFVLVQLDRRGRILLHPARTNREILRSLPPREPIKEVLAEMISLFNAVRYGGFPCDKPEFDRFLGLSDRLTEGH